MNVKPARFTPASTRSEECAEQPNQDAVTRRRTVVPQLSVQSVQRGRDLRLFRIFSERSGGEQRAVLGKRTGFGHVAAVSAAFCLIKLRLIKHSAICTALRAAPLRKLSDTTHMARPFSTVGSLRIRLT